jgi:CheY-like chemotaxis protein
MSQPLLLVIEDSARTRATLERDFTSLGCRVEVVSSAEEARRRLDAGLRPDAMILDFHLPGQSGPEFFRDLSTDERFRSVPVVPFTSLMDSREAIAMPTLMDFVSTRESLNNRDASQAIVSKGGNENVTVTPGSLVLSVAHSLQRRGVTLPPEFLRALRPLLRSLAV